MLVWELVFQLVRRFDRNVLLTPKSQRVREASGMSTWGNGGGLFDIGVT